MFITQHHSTEMGHFLRHFPQNYSGILASVVRSRPSVVCVCVCARVCGGDGDGESECWPVSSVSNDHREGTDDHVHQLPGLRLPAPLVGMISQADGPIICVCMCERESACVCARVWLSAGMELEREMTLSDNCDNESVYYGPYKRPCVCVHTVARWLAGMCVCGFYNTDYIYYRAVLCPAVAGLA